MLSVLSAGFIAQALKIITRSIKEKKFASEAVFDMGGVPSAHSALVSSLAVSVGILEGFGSDLFWIVIVFAAVIMYDAMGVRRAAGMHSVVLNKLIRIHGLKSKKFSEHLGHSPSEVFIGACLGVICAIVFTLI